MEEKDSAISGPYEEFRICFCGKIPSGSVEWYGIDVSVEEACLSEKTESSTRELAPFSVTKHLPSYAALGGHIYSLGGQRRSSRGVETLLNDVWLLDFKNLKAVSIPLLGVEDREPTKKSSTDYDPDEAQAQKSYWEPSLSLRDKLEDDGMPTKIVDEVPAQALETKLVPLEPGWKPGSSKSHKRKFSGTSLIDRWILGIPRGWKPGLPMNFARCNPHTMVVEHKLYVLGGLQRNQNPANGWIEVFNPEEKKWESLPSPPDQIHPSIMISGLRNSKKEIIIAKQRRDCHPLLFYSYNITTGCWNTVVPPESELSVHFESKASVHPNVERSVILPPNIGRAVTVGNTLYWISTEEHNDKCTILAYDLDKNMWFEDHLNTATIFGRHEYFSSIYSRGPGFLHLVDQKFCLLLQSTVVKKGPQSSIEYFYCVILDISPIYEREHENWGKFELTTVSVQKYSMDHYIDFLDCMLLLSD